MAPLNVPTKPFLLSKLNWLGILTTVAGLFAVADKFPPAVAKWVLVASGVAAVILRTFFTSTAIGSSS